MIEQNCGFLSWASPARVHAATLPQTVYGRGLHAYLLAAIVAFSNQKNCGFIRKRVKSHGLKAKTEEPLNAHRDSAALIDLSETSSSTTYSDLPRLDLQLFATPPVGLLERPHLDAGALERAKSQIRVMSGNFTLSSGRIAMTYVDTVPMSLTFSSASVMAAVASRLCKAADVIVAPPYGGASLGVMMALQTGLPLLVPTIESTQEKISYLDVVWRFAASPQRVLFVDDFYSTGSTLKRVFSSHASDVQVFAICAPTIARQSAPNMKVAFETDRGIIHTSPDCRELGW